MKKELFPVMLLTLVNTFNFSILIPVLPFIVKQYGGDVLLYGVLLSAYPLFQFFATPILGRMSDHFGRRPILLLSQAGTTLSWVIFVLAFFVPNITVGSIHLPILILLIARIADGITGGNNSVANAYLSDITTKQEKTRAFGLIGGIVGVGLILGPVVGGLTMNPSMGYLGPILTTLTISILTLIIMIRLLPESLERENRMPNFSFNWIQELNFIPRVQKYAANRKLKYLFFLRIMFLYAFTSFTSIFTLYLIDKFSFDSHSIGLFFIIIGIFLIFNQVVMVNILSKALGDLNALLFGQVSMVVSQLMYMFAGNLWIFTPILYLNNLGFSVSMPLFKSMMTKCVDKNKQGEILGIDESFIAASAAIAPLVATWIYANIGGYTFAAHSIIIFAALVIFWVKRGWK